MSYYAPDYFGGTTPGLGLIEADQPLSDARALVWVRDLLTDSGLFASVGLGKVIRAMMPGQFPSAWVYPISFTESDDCDPTEITRKLTYAVRIIVRSDDDVEAMVEMDRLSNAVSNLLSSDGPEGYIPGLSRIESGRYDTIPLGSSTPTIGTDYTGLTLQGTISYLVEGRSGRDQADDF